MKELVQKQGEDLLIDMKDRLEKNMNRHKIFE